MSVCLTLTEVYPDDLLADWRRYCRARGMTLGGFPGAQAHTVTLAAESHRLRVTVEAPDGDDAEDTLRRYLRDYMRRNPHLILTGHADEAALLEQTQYEGTVGFIID